MDAPLIRRRSDADLPALVTALREVYRADRYPSVWPEDALAFVRGGRPVAAWVGLSGGVPVGQVILSAAPGGGLEVKRLFVSPAARGVRLAEQLMQAAQAEGERLGHRLTLQVQEKNRAAIRLYGRLGWVHTGQGSPPGRNRTGPTPPSWNSRGLHTRDRTALREHGLRLHNCSARARLAHSRHA